MKLKLGKAQDAHVDGELLSGYLDNQVTSDERRRVEEHLRTCADCRAELSSLRQTVALLHAMPRVAVPRAFTLSEAAVGARRPAAATVPWFWGAARALGAVAALVVIAALAVLIIRPGQGALPAGQVAMQKAPAAAAPTAGERGQAAPAAAPLSPSAAPAPLSDQEAPTPSQQVNPAPATALAAAPAAAPTTAPRQAAPAQPQAVAPKSAPAATAAPAGATQPSVAAPLGPSSESAAGASTAPASPFAATSPSAAAGATSEAGLSARSMGLAASPTQSMSPMPTPPPGLGGAAAATGLGGGYGPNGAVTPPPLPPAAPLASTLPAGAGIVYADQQNVVAVDSRGTRTLAQGQDVSMPSISPDRAWVAYRVQTQDHVEVWAVRWDGSDAHLLASESALPGYEGRLGPEGPHITDVRWIPGGHTLSLLLAVPDPQRPYDAPANALWAVSADNGGLHKLLALDPANVAYSFSPDGSTLAVLERGLPGQGQGFLILYNSDGSNARTGLEFPSNSKGYGYESQLAWLPDNSAVLAAIPDQDAEGFGDNSGVSLYRVSSHGRQAPAQLIGRVSGTATFWSLNGKVLAFDQVDNQGLNGTLNLANADGSNAVTYAPLSMGRFTSWSPDNRHFIYANGGQIYVGAQGETPRAIAPEDAVYVAQWIGPSQVIYVVNQGGSWALASYSLDGKNNSLGVTLPQMITLDMTQK